MRAQVLGNFHHRVDFVVFLVVVIWGATIIAEPLLAWVGLPSNVKPWGGNCRLKVARPVGWFVAVARVRASLAYACGQLTC
jgi:hypothetical protein